MNPFREHSRTNTGSGLLISHQIWSHSSLSVPPDQTSYDEQETQKQRTRYCEKDIAASLVNLRVLNGRATARPPVEHCQVERPCEGKEQDDSKGPQDDRLRFGRHEIEIYQAHTMEKSGQLGK
jgi:hypothetical protein